MRIEPRRPPDFIIGDHSRPYIRRWWLIPRNENFNVYLHDVIDAREGRRRETPVRRDCWSLFITGPRVREWGFHCGCGWRIWSEFVDQKDRGQIGRGCD